MKKNREKKRVYSVRLHLYEVPEQAKLINSGWGTGWGN